MGIVPVILAGLKDSVNPCAVLVLALFILLLLLVGKTQKHVLVFGTYFLTGMFAMMFFLLIGSLDSVFGTLKAQKLIWYSQFGMAAIAFGIAIALLRDWWLERGRGGQGRVWIDFPIATAKASGAGQNDTSREAPLDIGALFLGTVAAVLISIWPTDYTMAVVFYNTFMPGKKAEGYFMFALYSFIHIVPLIAAFAAVLYLMNSAKFAAAFRASMAKVKIVGAAVFTALGLGLIKIFY